MIYTLKNTKLQIKVNTFGAEIKSVVGFDGFEYMWQGAEDFWSDTAPVLFPICGRLLNATYIYDEKEYHLKGHGFACNSEFNVVHASDEKIILSLKSDDETKKVYPFDFKLIIEYRLDSDRLIAVFNVSNESKVTMPYMFGWHPGFNLENTNNSKIEDFYLDYGRTTSVNWYPIIDGWVRADSEKYNFNSPKVALDEELIYKYDTLIYEGTEDKVVLSSPLEPHTVDLSWSNNLPYLCIWKEPNADARFICLEPWSAIPSDGSRPECFNDRKMNRLPQGKTEVFSYTVTFK